MPNPQTPPRQARLPLHQALRQRLARRAAEREQGSMLLDVLIGIAIFGLMALIATSGVNGYRTRSYQSDAANDAQAIGLLIEADYTETDRYPYVADVKTPTSSLYADSNEHLATGNSVAWYTVATDGGSFSLCVEHKSGSTKNAYARYDSTKGAVTQVGKGSGCPASADREPPAAVDESGLNPSATPTPLPAATLGPDPVTSTPTPTATPAPSCASVSRDGDDLIWSAVSGATSYNVNRQVGGSVDTLGTTTSATRYTAPYDSSASFQVVPRNSGGNATGCPWVNMLPAAPFPTPFEVRNQVVTTNSSGIGTFTFSQPFATAPVVVGTGGNLEDVTIVSVTTTGFTALFRNAAGTLLVGPVRLHWMATPAAAQAASAGGQFEARNQVVVSNSSGVGTFTFSQPFATAPIVVGSGGNGEDVSIVSVTTTGFTALFKNAAGTNLVGNVRLLWMAAPSQAGNGPAPYEFLAANNVVTSDSSGWGVFNYNRTFSVAPVVIGTGGNAEDVAAQDTPSVFSTQAHFANGAGTALVGPVRMLWFAIPPGRYEAP